MNSKTGVTLRLVFIVGLIVYSTVLYLEDEPARATWFLVWAWFHYWEAKR